MRSYESFVEYLCLKDPRIRLSTLDFGGRNQVLYMTAGDFGQIQSENTERF